ncbi:MAG TPA: hypothetical protein VGE30_00195 [Candidatus Saccharimonadales bacterium]
MDGTQQPENQDGSWQFRPEGGVAVAPPQPEVMTPRSVATPPTGSSGAISWTASEFVAHQKSGGWYGMLGVGAFLAALIIWFITKDMVSAVVILLAALAFGVFAARQPRELSYRLDDHGLTIGPRQYAYGNFRSFAIMREGAFASIVFAPLKRFAPLTTIYYDPNDEAKIVDLLSDRLPMEERKHDPIERLMWRIRF